MKGVQHQQYERNTIYDHLTDVTDVTLIFLTGLRRLKNTTLRIMSNPLQLPSAPNYRPKAPPSSIVQGTNYRLTILTDGLIRYEWSQDGKFEDRASTFAVYRDLPTPTFQVVERDNRIDIITDRVQIEYDQKAFSPEGFHAVLREYCRSFHGYSFERWITHTAEYFNKTWRYGRPDELNLGGTARTLDFADGRCQIGPGVLSKVNFLV